MYVKHERAQAASAISDALNVIAPQAQAAGITIEHVACGAVPYQGDEDRVLQVLLNLLANAVKFTNQGGRITVSYGTIQTPDVEVQAAATGPWVSSGWKTPGSGSRQR